MNHPIKILPWLKTDIPQISELRHGTVEDKVTNSSLRVNAFMISSFIVNRTSAFPLQAVVLMFPPFQVRLHSPGMES